MSLKKCLRQQDVYMKKLLFNLRTIQPTIDAKHHGVGTYGEAILREMIIRQKPIECYYDARRWINPDIKSLLDDFRIPLFDISKTSLDTIIGEGEYNCLYSPSSSLEERKISNLRVVTVQHDLRQFELPHNKLFWKYKNIGLKRKLKYLIGNYWKRIGYVKQGDIANHLKNNPNLSFYTVSYHSQSMLYNFFPELRKKEIPVFYCPPAIPLDIDEVIYKEKFFLMLSGNRYEKNIISGIMALDSLFSEGLLADYHVKITGVKNSSIFSYKIKNIDKFDFLDFVDNTTLNHLFHDAYCLIFPSFHEGFGFPAIESMRYSVPVLASAISSIPEICGDGAMYFSPFSIDEIRSRILLITNPKIHSFFSDKAAKRYVEISKKQKEDLDNLMLFLFA